MAAVAIRTDFQAELHALLNNQDCAPSEHQSWAFNLRLERAAILKMLIYLYV
jgi:hypothetical protein